jgi:type II secretory pathway component PulF
VLLEAGKPAPEALYELSDPAAFPGAARRRIQAACRRVEQGEALADALYQGGILPRACVPLVGAAERSQRLPWALAELGEELAARSARGLKRGSLFVFSSCVILIGILAGYMAHGMFIPLVDLVWRLSA